MTKKNEQALAPYREPPSGLVGQTTMVPMEQVEGIVRIAVTAALEATARSQVPAKRTVPGRDAEDDVRLVLRTADFLLRACGITLRGSYLVRGDGAYFTDVSMVEGYRMLRQLMTAYAVSEEPIEIVHRPATPDNAPHAEPYDSEAILDSLEGGWGRER